MSSSTSASNKPTITNTAEALEFVAQHEFIELRFTDLNGVWHHMALPTHNVDEDFLNDGQYFDGSSVIGWQPIDKSDMIFQPDITTFATDPFPEKKTCVVICDILNPDDRSLYSRDPRSVAKKATAYLSEAGVADTVYFGPEGEFFLFDGVSFANNEYGSSYNVDSEEGWWNSTKDTSGSGSGNTGYKISAKRGYFPCPPVDKLNDIRNEMVTVMDSLGLKCEAAHHEVGSAQCEIDFKFDQLLEVADKMQWYKHTVKNVAAQAGKFATFMPKPIFNDNGSGMHCHQSLWNDGENLFTGDVQAGLSQLALYYLGGIIKHSRALCVFTNPTTNSYKRLTPGFEAPTNMVYSARNRSAAVRIPMSSDKGRRIEYRTPDPMANPYLCFSALLMAGLDGIKNKIDPGLPTDVDLFELSADEIGDIVQAPASLEEAVEALKADREFLEAGDVFTSDLIDMVISLKEEEIAALNKRPHPFEWELYGAR